MFLGYLWWPGPRGMLTLFTLFPELGRARALWTYLTETSRSLSHRSGWSMFPSTVKACLAFKQNEWAFLFSYSYPLSSETKAEAVTWLWACPYLLPGRQLPHPLAWIISGNKWEDPPKKPRTYPSYCTLELTLWKNAWYTTDVHYIVVSISLT